MCCLVRIRLLRIFLSDGRRFTRPIAGQSIGIEDLGWVVRAATVREEMHGPTSHYELSVGEVARSPEMVPMYVAQDYRNSPRELIEILLASL
jgi:hypothetical protein